MRPDGCSHREGCLKQLIRRHVVQVAVFQTKTVVAFILPLQGSMLPLGVVGTDKMEVFDVLRLSALHTVDCRHMQSYRAGDGIRTHAIQLGKLVPYRLATPASCRVFARHDLITQIQNLFVVLHPTRQWRRDSTSGILSDHGADDGIRTHDHLLGKQGLYH